MYFISTQKISEWFQMRSINIHHLSCQRPKYFYLYRSNRKYLRKTFHEISFQQIHFMRYRCTMISFSTNISRTLSNEIVQLIASEVFLFVSLLNDSFDVFSVQRCSFLLLPWELNGEYKNIYTSHQKFHLLMFHP